MADVDQGVVNTVKKAVEEELKEKKRLEEEAAAKKKKSSWKMSGRVHLDNWNFTDTDPGVNLLETGNPADDNRSQTQHLKHW